MRAGPEARGKGPARSPEDNDLPRTFLAALRCDRIAAAWVLDGPVNGESFRTYVVKIWIRYTGVKVTNAGAHFLDQVRTAIENLDCAVKAAGMAGRVGRGNLKIGIFFSLASGFLPELLRCFSARHPEVEVNIVEGAPRENLTRLCAWQLDIAFVMGEPAARDCDVVRLRSERVCVVLPDMHALCIKDAIAWEDLRNEIFILSRPERGLAIHNYAIRRLATPDRRPDVHQCLVARDTLAHMVALGQGISLLIGS